MKEEIKSVEAQTSSERKIMELQAINAGLKNQLAELKEKSNEEKETSELKLLSKKDENETLRELISQRRVGLTSKEAELNQQELELLEKECSGKEVSRDCGKKMRN